MSTPLHESICQGNSMRRLILAASLLASLAARAEEPATLILPTPVVSAIGQYLSQRPYAEVAGMIAALQGCASVQVPNAQGAIVSHGECPAVTTAMQKPNQTTSQTPRHQPTMAH